MITPTAAQFHEFEIEPGATTTAYGEGDSFLVVQSNVKLEIMREGAPFLPFEQGDREDLPAGVQFSRLEVRNPTLSVALVKMYSGFGRRVSQRQAVVEPATRVRAYGGPHVGVLPANTAIELPGAMLAGEIRRKAVTVSNDSETSNLKLRTTALGGDFATVYAGFPIIFPISEPVWLFNPNPGPVAYSAGEIFWVA